jgi:hypothetical protein
MHLKVLEHIQDPFRCIFLRHDKQQIPIQPSPTNSQMILRLTVTRACLPPPYAQVQWSVYSFSEPSLRMRRDDRSDNSANDWELVSWNVCHLQPFAVKMAVARIFVELGNS